jgi:hypothetical protein
MGWVHESAAAINADERLGYIFFAAARLLRMRSTALNADERLGYIFSARPSCCAGC